MCLAEAPIAQNPSTNSSADRCSSSIRAGGAGQVALCISVQVQISAGSAFRQQTERHQERYYKQDFGVVIKSTVGSLEDIYMRGRTSQSHTFTLTQIFFCQTHSSQHISC